MIPRLPKTALRACPFCRGVDLMVLSHRLSMTEAHYELSCKGCGAGAGDGETIEKAAEKWNTRAETNHDQSDLTNALGIQAIVYGMMHKIPDGKLFDEAVDRGWIVTPLNADLRTSKVNKLTPVNQEKGHIDG
jgi:Lar family restriction alleviation protein